MCTKEWKDIPQNKFYQTKCGKYICCSCVANQLLSSTQCPYCRQNLKIPSELAAEIQALKAPDIIHRAIKTEIAGTIYQMQYAVQESFQSKTILTIPIEWAETNMVIHIYDVMNTLLSWNFRESDVFQILKGIYRSVAQDVTDPKRINKLNI